MKDLKEKTIRGGAARLIGQALKSLLRLGTIIVLARLLDPSDFGIVAMVTVVTGVFEIFATGGLSAAAVQKPEISDAEISTLFWFNIAIGALLGLLCIAAAPVLSAFYSEPKTALVMIAIAPAFVINATGVQHIALLQRHLRYVTLAAIEVGSEIVTGVVAISHGPCRVRLLGRRRERHRWTARPHDRGVGDERLAARAAAKSSRRLPDAALWRHSHAQRSGRLRRLQSR